MFHTRCFACRLAMGHCYGPCMARQLPEDQPLHGQDTPLAPRGRLSRASGARRARSAARSCACCECALQRLGFVDPKELQHIGYPLVNIRMENHHWWLNPVWTAMFNSKLLDIYACVWDWGTRSVEKTVNDCKWTSEWNGLPWLLNSGMCSDDIGG